MRFRIELEFMYVRFLSCLLLDFSASGQTLNHTRSTMCVGLCVCLCVCVCVCVCRWMWVFYSSDARMSLYAYNDKVNRNRVESKKHNQSKPSWSIIHLCRTWGGHSDYKGFWDLKLLVTYKHHPACNDFSQHGGNQYSDILHGVLYAKFSLIFLMLKASFHTKTGHESLEGSRDIGVLFLLSRCWMFVIGQDHTHSF